MIFCSLTLAYALLVFQQVHALATNRTIDDQNGDSVTGELPSYFPVVGWSQGNKCEICSAQPNPQQVFDHTWHDNTISILGPVDELSITMSFNGTAVYAYCILDNNNTYTTFTNLTFSLDGALVGSFSHGPDGSGSYVYDALVYSNTSIPNGDHTFVIHSPRGSADSFVLFDYVQYTHDPDHPTSKNSTTSNSAPTSPNNSKNVAGAIAGGTIGGVLALALILGVIFFLFCRRRHRSDGINYAPPDASRLETGIRTAGIPSRNLNSSIPSPFIVSAASDGRPQGPFGKAQREEISRQLEERQQQLMALQRAPPSRPPLSSLSTAQTTVDTVDREQDAVLESQVEALRREVARLREMMELSGNEAPPQYYGDVHDNSGPVPRRP